MGLELQDILAIAVRYAMTIHITDLLDIGIMAFVLYRLLLLVRSTKVESLLKGVLVFLLLLLASTVFQLHGINFILGNMVQVGALALIILFQPEIRRILEQLGSSRKLFGFFAHTEVGSAIEQAIAQTVVACSEMSKSRTGALMVFERELRLDDLARGGTIVDATVSSELIKNIFFVKSPLHDGAVIVRNGRLLAAGCVLPLSKNENLSRELGTRHRAGIGMSENSDALVVIVSEETGSISVAVGGMLKRHLSPETLDTLLHNDLMPQEEQETNKSKIPLLTTIRTKIGGSHDGD